MAQPPPSSGSAPGAPPGRSSAAGGAATLSVAALLVLAGLAGAFRIKAYDLFWHLAAGRWILEHGRVPRSDPFRFTSGGAPWVDHEWLFQVVAALAERAVGLEGLVLLRAMAAVALAVLLLCALRRSGAPTGWAVPVVLAALLGARPRLFLRPELVTVLALPVLLTLLQGFRRAATDRVRRATGAAATVLVLIWANLHPGALAAVPVALAHLVGCRVPGGSGAPRRGDRRPSWIVVAGLPAALGATLLATPHGIRIFAVPAAIGRSLEDLPGVNPEWLPLWHPTIARDSLFFFAAVGGLLVLAAVTARRAGRVDPATGLAALALLGLATTSIRHQALAFVGAAFFAGECLADVARASGEAVHHPRAAREAAGAGAPSPRSTALAVVLCVVASLWVIAPPSRGPLVPRQGLYHLGVGLEPERFPVHLTDAVEAEWPRIGNLYNNVAWGGYLLWRLYPPRRVFVDGRNEVDPEILRELAAARRSSSAWNDLLQRYRIDGAVVRYDDRTLQVMTPEAQSGPTSGPAPTARPEAGPGGGHGTRPGAAPTFTRRSPHALLFPRERFALVAWDDAGMLFVRRTPERSDRLAGVEYRALHPEDRAWTLERAAADPAFRRAALAEARRRLAQQPPSERARELYEALVEL